MNSQNAIPLEDGTSRWNADKKFVLEQIEVNKDHISGLQNDNKEILKKVDKGLDNIYSKINSISQENRKAFAGLDDKINNNILTTEKMKTKEETTDAIWKTVWGGIINIFVYWIPRLIFLGIAFATFYFTVIKSLKGGH